MGSWYYAFLFPASQCILDPSAAAATLIKEGFEVPSSAHRMIAIDDQGHVGGYGPSVRLGDRDALIERLANGETLFMYMEKDDKVNKVLTTMACAFSTQVSNPHIYFGWHIGVFQHLPAVAQNAHWISIRKSARAARAAYIVLVVEASATFADRFIEIDGIRVLDTACHHRWGHGIWAVWVNPNLGGKRPDGVAEETGRDLGDGFFEYRVT